MTINLKMPDIRELRPRITVFGVGGAGGNAVNNMIESGLMGVDFVVANTDAQALTLSKSERIIQMGVVATEGLGAGSQPDVGRAAAEEVIDEIRDHLSGAHMAFITAGMGGGTGTGSAPVVARAAREMGILTVGVVTKPFHFEGQRRMKIADAGIEELQRTVDTLIVIPNQNLFRVANERTTFADAFAMADQVLYSGVACITDLMVKEGLINLDFADVRSIMREMGKAMMGTGEATGEKRAILAAEGAIANPLLDDVSMKGARGLLISITGGNDLTLYEVDEAATRIREEVDPEANIILGATFDENLEGTIRVSVVATGIDHLLASGTMSPAELKLSNAPPKPRAPQAEEQAPTQVYASAAVPAAQHSAEQPEQRAYPQIRPAAPPQALAQAVEAAVSEPYNPAVATRDSVTIRPMPARPVMFEEPEAAPHVAAYEEAEPESFVPPAAERIVRAPRMPRIEELPLPAQNQLRQSRGEQVDDPRQAMEKKRMTLLQRLAAVGLGRREEDESMHHEPAPMPSAPLAPVPSHPEYGKRQMPRAPQGNLDAHGRAAQPPRALDDDQLDIPAFLRRQAN